MRPAAYVKRFRAELAIFRKFSLFCVVAKVRFDKCEARTSSDAMSTAIRPLRVRNRRTQRTVSPSLPCDEPQPRVCGRFSRKMRRSRTKSTTTIVDDMAASCLTRVTDFETSIIHTVSLCVRQGLPHKRGRKCCRGGSRSAPMNLISGGLT